MQLMIALKFWNLPFKLYGFDLKRLEIKLQHVISDFEFLARIFQEIHFLGRNHASQELYSGVIGRLTRFEAQVSTTSSA